MSSHNRYDFSQNLLKANIRRRENGFTLQISGPHGIPKAAHWPATTPLEDLELTNLPCLVSQARRHRASRFTIEAVGLGEAPMWVGVNQNRANRVVEHFLTCGALPDICSADALIKAEVPYRDSRFDFQIGDDTFLEVKTPIHYLSLPSDLKEQLPKRRKRKTYSRRGQWGQRIKKHFNTLRAAIDEGYRVIAVVCFLYPAAPWRFGTLREGCSEAEKATTRHVIAAERAAIEAGMELYQLNAPINPQGIELRDFFRAHYAA